MTHVLVRIYFRLVLTWVTYLSALGSQQGILISASTVSHCGSLVWKNRSCSEHQYWRSTAVITIMSMLNLQIHLLWAFSRQHECGIKQNKSESILPSVMLGRVTIRLYVHLSTCVGSIPPPPPPPRICVYEFMNKKWFSRHIWIHAWCEFMNRKWFSRLTISRRPTSWWHVLTQSFVQLQVGCSPLIPSVLVCCAVFY